MDIKAKIQAIRLATGEKPGEVAKRTGDSLANLGRKRKKPEFQMFQKSVENEVVREAKKEVVDTLKRDLEKLVLLRSRAIRELEDLLDSTLNEKLRFNICASILDRTGIPKGIKIASGDSSRLDDLLLGTEEDGEEDLKGAAKRAKAALRLISPPKEQNG